ncbi:eukaryotic translation initiation factor 3 subunit A-like isoform X2 [Acanthaster planci]|uniref:Eukaryotic translation initiation factor 3 subunit A-like isoform X2 n=1 Tax=Acanthaster planci TaxID=133434 RepID=A0A8B7YZG8_ACAPL|nr:eukaryotic translation initiation factor 3 subunit A-like isoform X2 [Acanthaster planci]
MGCARNLEEFSFTLLQQPDVGGKVYHDFLDFTRKEREDSVNSAVRETQEAAERRLKKCLHDAYKKAEADKQQALKEARLEAKQTAARVAEARDQLEAERIEKLTWAFKIEKEEALQKQWEECERIKKKAVEDAIAATTKRLRKEFALEKELAIAKALSVAREKFKKRLEEAIKTTKEECERKAAEEAARVAKLHREEVLRLEHIIEDLQRQIRDEIEAREMVQNDFKAIQQDYRRFLDYTDGKYHSDYLMRLRKHGMRYDIFWDRRSSEDVDIFPLPTFLHNYTRQGKVRADDPSAKVNRFVALHST